MSKQRDQAAYAHLLTWCREPGGWLVHIPTLDADPQRNAAAVKAVVREAALRLHHDVGRGAVILRITAEGVVMVAAVSATEACRLLREWAFTVTAEHEQLIATYNPSHEYVFVLVDGLNGRMVRRPLTTPVQAA